MEGFIENYTGVLKKYMVFEGRAGLREFWMFVLASFLASLILSLVKPLSTLYGLAVLMPSLAVGARRLHDTGRSGWWQLIGLIPIIGWIILIIFAVLPGEAGANKYGPAPVLPKVPTITE